MTTLCIDLGTTRLKVALIGADGTLIEQRAARIPDLRADGPAGSTYAWQNAAGWWHQVGVLTRLLAPTMPLDAVSLSGRGGAAVFVDAARRVVVDPWSDARHAEQQRKLRTWRRDERHVSNYASALLAKALWVREQQPHAWARVRHVLYAKDYLLLQLTGRALTDPASGPDAMEWPADLLDTIGINQKLLPEVGLPWHIAGSLTAEAARALGVRAGLPVAVGAHDGICANIGCGAAAPGQWALTLGTHAVVRAVTSSVPAGARRFYGLAPDRHIIGGNGLYGGRAADWFADLLFGADDPDRQTHLAALERAAAAVPAGANGVDFAPFLGGQVAPRWQPQATAGFSGLQPGSGSDALYRAILEGTAHALRDITAQLAGWCGAPQRLRLTGGGARSALWCQLLADMLNVPLETTGEAAENTGAAICAAVATGRHPNIDAAVQAMVRCQQRYMPDERQAAAYAELHARWTRHVGVS